MIDTHCHLDFAAFDDDRGQVIERAAQQGVARIINPGIDLETSGHIVRLAEQFAAVFAAVGIHPNSSAAYSPEQLTAIERISRHPKVVAIGEIGLDYHWDTSPPSLQRAAFEGQLELAARLGLPVIIHNREASSDLIAVLESWAAALPQPLREHPGVLHSFSGDDRIAERALAAGFYLGFTGPITYKNADDTRRIAAAVPLDRLLVETDAPFLTPVPHRGKRNEPAYVRFVVERLADVKQVSAQTIRDATTTNAVRLFRLPA